jgi:hypothetical protein
MQTEYLIAVDEFCTQHNIEASFISSLQQNGLIEISTIRETRYIDPEQLKQLEMFIHFFYELDINLEGIETINHLLLKIYYLQDEITTLRNKLRLYESEL